MRIDSQGVIAGRPAIAMRDFMSYAARLGWLDEKLVRDRFHISASAAQQVVGELCAGGYIEASLAGESPSWKPTLKGAALGLATAGKPLRRATADRLIAQFVERCRAVSANREFLFRVKHAWVFGSYLSQSDTLNDVDIGIELEAKEADPAIHSELCRAKSEEAARAGRGFRNIVDYLFWPQRETTLFLKSRSTGISLHLDDPILSQVEKKQVFPD